MKKSQLRKIIRESIKSIHKEASLLNEQSGFGMTWNSTSPNLRDIWSGPCQGFGGAWVGRRATVNGQVPVAGDVIIINPNSTSPPKRHIILRVDPVGQGPMGSTFNSCCYTYNFQKYTGPDCCSAICGTQTSLNFNGNSFNAVWLNNNAPNLVGPQAMDGGCSTNTGNFCCGNPAYAAVDPSACGNTSQPSSGCDPSAPFPPNFNLSSWTNTWTSLPNFSNTTNPNQPCNFVCQRRNQWQNQINAGGMGPKQTNMVACRLAEAENQYQIHNCATSNANNCP